MDSIFTVEGIIAFLTLVLLEIILGIDNLIFISILVGKVEASRQKSVRFIGLGLALLFRIALLLSITWIVQLTEPVLTILQHHLSWHDIILLSGGLFLVGKSTTEIHAKLEYVQENSKQSNSIPRAISGILLQIIVIDMIFSMDSILTAVGLTDQIATMITAIIISVMFMMIFAGYVSVFIHEHPTVIVLALSFLIMIGMLLIADAFHFHIPRAYVYFALGFSLIVEILNLKLLKRYYRKRTN